MTLQLQRWPCSDPEEGHPRLRGGKLGTSKNQKEAPVGRAGGREARRQAGPETMEALKLIKTNGTILCFSQGEREVT